MRTRGEKLTPRTPERGPQSSIRQACSPSVRQSFRPRTHLVDHQAHGQAHDPVLTVRPVRPAGPRTSQAATHRSPAARPTTTTTTCSRSGLHIPASPVTSGRVDGSPSLRRLWLSIWSSRRPTNPCRALAPLASPLRSRPSDAAGDPRKPTPKRTEPTKDHCRGSPALSRLSLRQKVDEPVVPPVIRDHPLIHPTTAPGPRPLPSGTAANDRRAGGGVRTKDPIA